MISESSPGTSLDIPLYNLGSSLYRESWEERLYGLQGSGHCHTFNPPNLSTSGLKGQHSFYLGLQQTNN